MAKKNKKAAKRVALTELIIALEEMEKAAQEPHPDKTVQWALNELSEEGNQYLFGPSRKVLDAYKAWKLFN